MSSSGDYEDDPPTPVEAIEFPPKPKPSEAETARLRAEADQRLAALERRQRLWPRLKFFFRTFLRRLLRR